MEPDLIKRAARAILREELRALRKRARDAEANAEAVCNEARMDRDSATRRADRLEGENANLKERTAKVLAWGMENRKGDFTIRACTEYILQGPLPLNRGAGFSWVNPFDRWQVLPAIK